MPFKFNPITGTLDLVNASGSSSTSSTIPSAIYMLSTTNSDIATYESMPILNLYTVAALGTITTSVTTAATLLGTFATNSGYPNTTAIPIGNITVHYEIQKASGGQSITSYCEIYKRASGGTETLLGTSDVSASTTVNTVQQITATSTISTAIVLLTTDRIVLKFYATLSASSVNVDFRYDDITNARLELPTSFVAHNPVTLDAIGSTPNANAATITAGQVLNLEPANGSFGGIVSTTTQTFSGNKTFNGTILGADGSAAAPEFSFSGATGLGAYRPSGNNYSIATAGTRRFNIDGNGFINGGVNSNFTDGNAMFQIVTINTTTPTIGAKLMTAQTANAYSVFSTANATLSGLTAAGGSHFGMSAALTNVSNSYSSTATTSATTGYKAITSQTAGFHTYLNNASTEIGKVTVGLSHQMPIGSQSAATYGFYSDAGTGLYSPASGSVGITADSSAHTEFDKKGNIRAYRLHNNSSPQGNSGNQDIRSGTYEPTATNLTNISGLTVNEAQWLRVGNVVTVSGVITDVSITASGATTSFELSLPVASSFTNLYDLGGSGAMTKIGALLNFNTATISAQVTNRTAYFEWEEIGGNVQIISYSYTYVVV